jgi:Protein of unknown function (DUF3105)
MRADVRTTSKEAMSDDEDTTPEAGVSARASAQDKLATIQRKQRREGRRGAVIASVVGMVLMLGIGGGATWFIKKDQEPQAGGGAYGEVKTYKLDDGENGKDRVHKTSGFKYKQEPPVGGPHHAAWANCGVYDKAVPPQYAVHSLEHGTVWITYKSSIPKAQVNKLKGIAQKQGDYILMSVNDKQSAPITLTAWGKQLRVKTPGDPAVDDFIKKYWKGPDTPEKGGSCQGAYDPNTGQMAGGM